MALNQSNETGNVQLAQLVSDPSPDGIIKEVKKIFCYHYPQKHYHSIEQSYWHVRALYEGEFPGYRACNTKYHDFSHSMDTLLASARLMDGYNLVNTPFPVDLSVKLMVSSLLHDTGYIQEAWDVEGTGGKYTTTHVARSIQFLSKNNEIFRIGADGVRTIGNMIWCTDLNAKIGNIAFLGHEEKTAGLILGTADLLCQMSNRAYMEKLIYLFEEFKEGGVPGFDVEYDIIRKTVDFYGFMKVRFVETLSDVRMYAQNHFMNRFSIDHNLYREAIERHIAYLREIIKDGNPDFRKKFRRWN
ncbi:MAG: hypothetical protein WC405_02180 [Syntrophales bacterium]